MSEETFDPTSEESPHFDDIFDGDTQASHEPIDDVYGPSTVIAALDQIEELVGAARALPMSASVLVNKAEMLDLLDQARQALPEDLLAADAVVADADALMVRADDVAESTVHEAKLRAEAIVEDARQQADELGTRSREDAEHTVSHAREEADSIIENARLQADAMIDQEQITQQARQRAEEIVSEAHEHAVNLTEGADKYCADSLNTLSESLDRIYHQTRAGLEAIEQRRAQRTNE
ncbi:MAG: hypothetical protein Q4P05_05535 [Actinomycetaceae bacterium]|nr:hypothetical protein [Actinomycetaceae bacterium]